MSATRMTATRSPATKRRATKRWHIGRLAVAATLGLGACTAGGAGSGDTRYIDQVFASVSRTDGLVYATAPDLNTGAPVTLAVNVFQPVGDTLAERPALLWVHGGGFKGGNRNGATVTTAATEYARRGYVTVTVDYRLDPGNRCQEVQDHAIPDPTEFAIEEARCRRAILAAQHDTQAAVRWLRANASTYGIDASKIAAGGFSAGAVTVVGVAERSEDPGDVGEHLDQPSTVSVSVAASGCNFDPGSIDPSDSPISVLASGHDQAVDFSCVVETTDRSEAAGIDTQRLFYPDEGGHAAVLYETHKATTDAAWTLFLAAHLGLM